MKKRDIVERIASEAGIAKQAAEAAVGSVFACIGEALASGEDVTVSGFGRFARTERPACEGRIPRTGERIAKGPSSGVSFNAGQALKDALVYLNSGGGGWVVLGVSDEVNGDARAVTDFARPCVDVLKQLAVYRLQVGEVEVVLRNRLKEPLGDEQVLRRLQRPGVADVQPVAENGGIRRMAVAPVAHSAEAMRVRIPARPAMCA